MRIELIECKRAPREWGLPFFTPLGWAVIFGTGFISGALGAYMLIAMLAAAAAK